MFQERWRELGSQRKFGKICVDLYKLSQTLQVYYNNMLIRDCLYLFGQVL